MDDCNGKVAVRAVAALVGVRDDTVRGQLQDDLCRRAQRSTVRAGRAGPDGRLVPRSDLGMLARRARAQSPGRSRAVKAAIGVLAEADEADAFAAMLVEVGGHAGELRTQPGRRRTGCPRPRPAVRGAGSTTTRRWRNSRPRQQQLHAASRKTRCNTAPAAGSALPYLPILPFKRRVPMPNQLDRSCTFNLPIPDQA